MANSDWTVIDPETLPQEIGDRYVQMKAAYRVYAKAKAEFESGMQIAFAGELPYGQELKFGYKFGKLSISTGPAVERKAAKATAKPSLADFLRARSESGLNS